MKIKKANACDLQKKTEIPKDSKPVLGEEGTECRYGTACDNIMQAIRELTAFSDDEVAQDSIANLSVVLFDLQQGGN